MKLWNYTKHTYTRKRRIGYYGWALNQELQPFELTQCWLKTKLILITKTTNYINITFTSLELKNSLEFYNKNLNPNDALGLYIYKTEGPNEFLKIREAWLSNLR